jgi:hypothetical protein
LANNNNNLVLYDLGFGLSPPPRLGMRINYQKSELIAINMTPEETTPFLRISNVWLANSQSRLPLHFQKLKREDLQPLIDSLLKRMAS